MEEDLDTKETKKDNKWYKWLWFILAFLFFILIITVLITTKLLNFFVFVASVLTISIIFLAIYLLIKWLANKNMPAEKRPLTMIEAQNILTGYLRQPPERGGMMMEFDLYNIKDKSPRTVGREKKVEIFCITGEDIDNARLISGFIRMDDPNKWGFAKANFGESTLDFYARVSRMIDSLGEYSGEYIVKRVFDRETQQIASETIEPTPIIKIEEEEEL